LGGDRDRLIFTSGEGTRCAGATFPPLQLTDINSLKVLANGVLGISAHIEIIWQNEACSKHSLRMLISRRGRVAISVAMFALGVLVGAGFAARMVPPA
jgi:hypothetical protein